MDDRVADAAKMKMSKLDELAPSLGGKLGNQLFGAASDVTLIVDPAGVILDAGFSDPELFKAGGKGWVGRPFSEVVTGESEQKVAELLEQARQGAKVTPREINHAMPHGHDAPVRYTAAPLNDDGLVMVFGQHIARVAALQRRLIDSQLSMEREFSRLRGAESRYRAIFQLSEVPMVVVDASNLRVSDINPAALRILGLDSKRVNNAKILSLFGESDADLIHQMLRAAIDDNSSGDINIKLHGGEVLSITAKLFRQERRSYLLLHLASDSGNVVSFSNANERRILDLMENMPDAFLVTNANRHILGGNNAFLELFNFANIREVEGQLIDTLFERPSVDCNVLMANVREHGTVRRFATIMRSRFGQTENVEIAATQVAYQDDVIMGFSIRPTSGSVIGVPGDQDQSSRSDEQIANLVGHMPLKDIVRETTDMIEKLCIETALELTQDNRASAAQMLGLSRQSLYAKLSKAKDQLEE